MAALVKGFKSEDLNEVKRAAREMSAFLARGKENPAAPTAVEVGP